MRVRVRGSVRVRVLGRGLICGVFMVVTVSESMVVSVNEFVSVIVSVPVSVV